MRLVGRVPWQSLRRAPRITVTGYLLEDGRQPDQLATEDIKSLIPMSQSRP